MEGVARRRFLLACASAFAGAAFAAPRVVIPLATDLQADGRLAHARREPIVVLFSLPGCPYCEVVRRSHLGPMLRDPKLAARMLIRQLDIDSDLRITGFSGEQTTHERIARAHGVRAAPVVAFWDGEGRTIADSLRGMLLPDFYASYLEQALGTARATLAARR